MSHLRRPVHLALLVSLVLASLAAAPRPPTARAAGTFVVTTTRDLLGASCGADASFPDLCSLHQALSAAVAAGGNSTIQFNIPASDSYGPMPGFDTSSQTWTITLSDALPLIQSVSEIVIDGGSQAIFSGLNNPGPLVFIDGTNVDNRGGLTIINASNIRISRLGIINFGGDPSISGDLAGVGIEISSSSGTRVLGCYIGVNQAGTGPAPNDAAGIMIQGGSGNVIGGNNSLNSEFNVISGNANDGILIRFSSNNEILGNRIGTNTSGSAAIPNGGNGVQLTLGSSGNRIGPPADFNPSDSTYRNIIAGNNGYGVRVNESSTTSINGNWIGANNLLNVRIPNKLGGVAVFSTNTGAASSNTIGGNTASTRNIIAGNNGPGVAILGPRSNDNKIANNYIGIGFSNSIPVSNTFGVLIDGGGDGNIVGGNGTRALNNVISGNDRDAIRITGASSNPASGNIISGNYIGTAANGTGSMPNAGAGIAIDTNVRLTRIGGTTIDASNVIAHNGGDGVLITGTQVLTNTLLKNTIAFNTGNGVRINGARSTLISGVDVAGANQIANNGTNGILVTGAVSTTIQFNALVSNGQNGVRVDGGAALTNIYTNTIFTNPQNGVLVQGNNTKQARIIDNKISGNGLKGIELDPETTWPNGAATNPNHDIDPPFNLRLNQAGRLTGRVRADNTNASTRAASCFNCKIQIFTTDPASVDGEGRDKVDVPVTITANGYFTATLSNIPRQLALTATDGEGNTSEFAVFDSTFGIAIGPPRASSAVPGQVITYTHRITNTGSVDFTDLRLTGASKLGWPFALAPSGDLALPADQSRPVTLTLTLPSGADPRVRAGLIETTVVTVTSTRFPTVTASLVDTTTVQPKVVLAVSPLTLSGFGTPGATARYAHTLTNNGNIAATVTLTASTNLGPTWVTSVTPISMTIQPGQSVGATVNVAVPQSAQKDTVAITTLRITVPADPTQNKLVTDTTTVELVPRATLTPDRTGDAGAGEKIQFPHVVENKSNGSATFRLTAVSSLGSTIRFIRTDGGTFGPDNSFTLGSTPGTNTLNFIAEVTVDRRAFRGDTDTVTISLLDTQGRVVATAQDRINVTRGAIVPRLYLPIVRR